MITKNYTKPHRSSWLALSLLLHACLVVGIITSYMHKSLPQLTPVMMPLPQEAQQPQAQKPQQEEKKETEKKKKPTLAKEKPMSEKPFVVPAPVVFYGNQTMMNNPTPIAGSPDGKSAFEEKPSALPTPATATITPEKTMARPPSLESNTEEAIIIPPAPAVEPKKATVKKEQAVPEKVTEHQEGFYEKPAPQEQPATTLKKEEVPLEVTLPATQEKPTPPTQKPAKKTLSLADLFKNAPTALAALTQTGEPSAKRAGTEGGDVNGSGHQITIKEGDMKYYSLWAKFLNHLNQAARFSRRGKERRIMELAQNGSIAYVLQCGITVDMHGKLLDIEILHSSGSKEFDDICMNDIRSAIPYPPLPETLGKKTARFEVNVYPS